MMISTKGRYALRVMLDMAEHGGEDNYLRLKDIADRLSLSRKYLETIMTELGKNSLVESAIGKAGGYKLKRPPKGYTAGEILHYTLQDLMDSAKNTREARCCNSEQEEHHEER